MKHILIALVTVVFIACAKKSEIKVTNRVSNCMLQNISFGDYYISGSPITNESTYGTEISDRKSKFPKKYPLKFYMVSKGNRVLLQTKQEYELVLEGTLNIIIENSTEVQTP